MCMAQFQRSSSSIDFCFPYRLESTTAKIARPTENTCIVSWKRQRSFQRFAFVSRVFQLETFGRNDSARFERCRCMFNVDNVLS